MNREQLLLDAGQIIGMICRYQAEDYERVAAQTPGLKWEYDLRLLAGLRRIVLPEAPRPDPRNPMTSKLADALRRGAR